MSVINKDFVVKSGIEVRGTAAVTTTTQSTTGSMYVASGLAVGKNLMVGGNTTLYGTTTTDALTVVHQATLGNVSAQRFTATNILANGPVEVAGTATLTVGTGLTTLNGNLEVNGTSQFNDNVEITGNKTFTVGTGSSTLNGTLDVVGHSTLSSVTATSATFTGQVDITDTTQAISTQSAAFTVVGGVGIGGNLHVGGEIIAEKLTIQLTTVTTTEIVTDDIISTENNTDAIGTDTGAITAVGGLGLGKGIWVGGKAIIEGLTTITNTTNSISSQSGALRVYGGVGIQQDVYVGGTVYANVTGNLTGTATTSTNLTGGATGSIPYQSDTGTTTFVSIGNNGYVLTSNGSAPTWQAVSGLSAGNATTATNLAGGSADQIPYQISAGNTGFSDNLKFDGSTFTTPNIAVTGTAVATDANSGALTVDGGVGINGDVFIGSTLNVTGQTTIGALTATITTATELTVIGQGSFGTLNVTNQATLGALTATITTATELTVIGQSNLGAVSAGALTATSIVVSGNGTLDVGTGTTTLGGTLDVTGQTTLDALTAGVTTATSLFVNGLITSGITQAQTTGSVVPALFSNAVLLSSYLSTTITGTGAANLDSFSTTEYRSARYYVQVYDSPNVHVSEISLFHNGTDAFIIEYGTGSSNGELGSFSATIGAGTVTLTFTPNPSATAMTIKLVRLALTS